MSIKEHLQKAPIANERLYKEVAAKTGLSPKQVEELVYTVSKFTKDVIKKGAFETVMVAGFGKFRVKQKQVQRLAQLKSDGKI